MSEDIFLDPEDRAKREADEKEALRRRQQELDDLRGVLSTPSGLRFYWRQLEECGLYLPSYVKGDPLATSFNEGRRSIGLKLLRDLIDADPGAYLRMVELQGEPNG